STIRTLVVMALRPRVRRLRSNAIWQRDFYPHSRTVIGCAVGLAISPEPLYALLHALDTYAFRGVRFDAASVIGNGEDQPGKSLLTHTAIAFVRHSHPCLLRSRVADNVGETFLDTTVHGHVDGFAVTVAQPVRRIRNCHVGKLVGAFRDERGEELPERHLT